MKGKTKRMAMILWRFLYYLKRKDSARVQYQDAASSPPFGFVPDLPEKEQKRVDFAILCVASFWQVNNYPEGIINTMRPKNIILGHWEDFSEGRKGQ